MKQRIINLLAGVADQPLALGDRQAFHQVPAREVRATHVAHLSRALEVVKCTQGFLDRRDRIEGMDLIQIKVVGAEPAQRVFAGFDQVLTRQPDVVDPRAHAAKRFGGQQHLVTPALDRRADNLLAGALGVDVGGVYEVQPCLQADVQKPSGFVRLDIAHVFEKVTAAEGHGAEREDGNVQAGAAEGSRFHKV